MRDFFPTGGPRGGDITKQFHGGDSQWLAGVIVAEDDQINSLAFHIVFTATCWCTYVKLIPGKDPKSIAAGAAAYHVLTLLNPYLADDAWQDMNYLRGKYLK